MLQPETYVALLAGNQLPKAVSSERLAFSRAFSHEESQVAGGLIRVSTAKNSGPRTW